MSEMSVLAYRYGLLPPRDWGEDCEAELRKANQLWNKLVEIERTHGEQVRAVAATDAAVVAARAE